MPYAHPNGGISRHYSAQQLTESCEITGAQLTSYISKAKIVLPSVSQGQGKARKFCLYDVYLIGLLAKLTDLTRNQTWSARSLEYLLYIGAEIDRKTYPIEEMVEIGPRSLNELRHDISTGAGQIHPLFTHRDIKISSWILFAESWQVDARLYGCKVVNSEQSASNFRLAEEGYFINATALLKMIDQRLTAAGDL